MGVGDGRLGLAHALESVQKLARALSEALVQHFQNVPPGAQGMARLVGRLPVPQSERERRRALAGAAAPEVGQVRQRTL